MAYRPPSTMADLRSYVTGPDGGGLNQGETTVLLHITHSNLKARFAELRFDLHMTVGSIKAKLQTHTGSNPACMTLILKDEEGRVVGVMEEDGRPLGFFSPRNGFTLHIHDQDPFSLSANGWLEDTSKVEKYVMSEDAYNARDNTYRKWKDQKLKEDPTWTLQKEVAKQKAAKAGQEPPPSAPRPGGAADQEAWREAAAKIQVGARCAVEPGERRGEVKYVGEVGGLPAGPWVGVQLDEPLGKNDGTVQGKRLFECPPGFGILVRPDKAAVGDYPPLDPFADEDEI